jgi:predicted dienelactone hydrolase
MPMFRRIVALIALGVALSACSPGTSGAAQTAVPALTPHPTLAPVETPTTELTPTSSATKIVDPQKPLYAAPGKFRVGRQDFTVQDAEETLNITAWYPELNGTPDITHGPYPLVVFSPGLGGSGDAYARMLLPIVTHGFVVMTSSPRGETMSEFWAGAATRPLDLQHIINYADELSAPGGQLAGLINTEQIAMAGHSSGGWTALVGGGAQMDLGLCAQPDLVDKLPYSNCPQFVPHQQEIAAMLGLQSVPTGTWPAMNDPRVDAVIAMSPDGDIWGTEYAGVAGVKVPTLIMAGSSDSLNAPELCAYPIYEHLGSTEKTLAVFEGGDHDLGWGTYADEIKHLITAFLLAKLKDDPEAANALLPANVLFKGVKYETTASNTK